jgi:hypothetical protein
MGPRPEACCAAWQPWRLLVGLAGSDGSLAERVRGAALSLEADPGGVNPAPALADQAGGAASTGDASTGETLVRLRGQLQFQD